MPSPEIQQCAKCRYNKPKELFETFNPLPICKQCHVGKSNLFARTIDKVKGCEGCARRRKKIKDLLKRGL